MAFMYLIHVSYLKLKSNEFNHEILISSLKSCFDLQELFFSGSSSSYEINCSSDITCTPIELLMVRLQVHLLSYLSLEMIIFQS